MSIQTLDDVRRGGHGLIAICRHTTCRYQRDIEIDRLIGRVGGKQKLLPVRSELHFTDQMRCPSCKRRGMNLWVEPSFPKVVPSPEPNFRVMDHGEAPYSGHDMIATANNLMVAKGAFFAAAHFYRERRITLMQGAFVVADSKVQMPEVMLPERYYDLRQGEAEMGRRTIPKLVPKVS